MGAGLALLYVTVALATNVLSSRPVLPLFDGFAPPTPYAWVNPPPDRAGDNVAPGPALVATSSSGSPTEVDQSDRRQVVLLVILGLAPIIGAFLVLRLPLPVPAAPPPGRRASTSSRTKAKKENKRRR